MRRSLTAGFAALAALATVTAGIVVPTAAFAAPAGSFSEVNFKKVADGYSLANNPVDTSADNNVVAVRDYVGLTIQGNTQNNTAVSGATMTLTKPSCWAWDSSVDSNLNFSLTGGGSSGSGASTGSVAHPDANTIVVTWSQAPSGTVETQPFRVQAGEGCADGSTWTPVLTVVDDSGAKSIPLPTLTVRSVASADISISAVGQPVLQPSRWFSGGSTEWGATGGAGPALVQRWDVALRPDTIAKTGYADPAGNITFTVAYNGPRSAFELPRTGSGTPNVQGSGCWVYVSPSATNNNQVYPSTTAQTVTITMKRSAACQAMLADNGNKLVIYSFTPQKVLEDDYACSAPLGATVAPTQGWQDQQGRPIADSDATNNTASVPLQCQTVVYDSDWGSAYFTPKVDGASLTDAYPENSTGHPIVAAGSQNTWQMLSTGTGTAAGSIGVGGTFTSEASLAPSAPTLTDLTSFHLWNPAVQQLDVARLDGAVLGAVRPASSAPGSRAFPAGSYTVACTTDYTGANSAGVGTMTWVDCTTLDPTKISGLRYVRAGVFPGENFGVNFPASKLVFSQVPMRVVGKVGDMLPTTTIWQAKELAQTTTYNVSAQIIGNVLRIRKSAADSQVMPMGSIHYSIEPTVTTPAGTFLPGDVENLRVVDTLDIGVMSVDTSALDPFWRVEQTPADLGPDQVPYTADDVRGITLTFTPAGAVRTDTVLPKIDYTAHVGILLPPQAAPYLATIRNTATVAADGMDPEVAPNVTPKRHTATASVLAGTPQAAFFSKLLISDPQIEVEDKPASWRVQWINYNNYDLGRGTFVDVFPYQNDARGTQFHGSLKLVGLDRIGAAQQAGTTVELTTAAPATIGATPAAGVSWTIVDPTNPASWPANPTGIRIVVPNIEASTQGYGAIDLRFEANGQHGGDIYVNDATGLVYDPRQQRAIDLGRRDGEPVRVVASSIGGVAWVDRNSDGIRQTGEALLPGIKVHLIRDGAATPMRTVTTGVNGAYLFDQLHSSNYQVVFDVADLKAKGYKLTTQGAGSDPAVDSDADETTGQVAARDLPKDTDVRQLDAGVIPIGLQASVSGAASLTRTYAWSIAKTVTGRDAIVPDPTTGTAEATFQVTTTEGGFTDSAPRLSGTIEVTNPSDAKTYTFNASVTASGTGVTCSVTNGQGRQIAPGASMTLAYTCVGAPGNDLDRTVTATIAATDTDPTTGMPVPPVSDAKQVAYAVNEIGKTIQVRDTALIAGVTRPETRFGPYTWSAAGTTHTESYAVPVTVQAGACVTVDNTATINETQQRASTTVSVCRPADLTVAKNVVTSLTRSYGWDIAKRLVNTDVAVDAQGKATLDYEVVTTEGARGEASWNMQGSVTVTNPNTYKSVSAKVTDTADIGGGAACTFAGGATVTVPAGKTLVLPYSCTFTSQPALTGVNTATVTWQSDRPGTDPALVEQRSATATAPIVEDDWKVQEFRRTVSIVDQLQVGTANPVDRRFGPYTWSAAGTVHTEVYSQEVTVPSGSCLVVGNTARVVDAGGQATTQHTLCNEAPLTVADTPRASLVRDFAWSIDKQLTNRGAVSGETSATQVRPEYRVRVTEGATRDSAHQLTGEIRIANPNDFRAYAVRVGDRIDIEGLTCVVDATGPVQIAAGATVTVPYRCTGTPDGDTLAGTHTVTVSGEGIEPVTTAASVAYDVVERNRTVTVVDDRTTFSPAWTITWNKSGTEHERSYALTVQTGACRTVDNTATIQQTGQKDTASFRNCRVVKADKDRDGLAITGSASWAGSGLLAVLAIAGGALLLIRRRRLAG